MSETTVCHVQTSTTGLFYSILGLFYIKVTVCCRRNTLKERGRAPEWHVHARTLRVKLNHYTELNHYTGTCTHAL